MKSGRIDLTEKDLRHKQYYEERLVKSDRIWKQVSEMNPTPFPIFASNYTWEQLMKMVPCEFYAFLKDYVDELKESSGDCYRAKRPEGFIDFRKISLNVVAQYFVLQLFEVVEISLIQYYKSFHEGAESILEILSVLPEARIMLIVVLSDMEKMGFRTNEETEQMKREVRKELDELWAQEEIHIKRLRDWGFLFEVEEVVSWYSVRLQYTFEKMSKDQQHQERLQRLDEVVNMNAKKNGYSRFKSINQLCKQFPHIDEAQQRAKRYYNRLGFIAASPVLYEEFMGAVGGE